MTRLAKLSLTVFVVVTGAGSALAQDAGRTNNLGRQLLNAVSNNNVATVRQLLDNGADIEAPGQNGDKALDIAVQQGDLAMVNLLLEKGAQVDAKDSSGETALIEAARTGNVEIVRILLPRTSDQREKNGALFAAAGGGPVEIQMQNPDSKVSDERAPRPVLESSWLKIARLLLESGANLEATDEDGSTPLTLAAAYGQTDIFSFLLDRGAGINVRDKNGNTPLIAAACECALATMNSTYDIVKILLQKGAAVNERNHEGATALMNAASGFGDAAIVKLLLDAAADPTLKDKKGNTALALAIKSDRADKIQLLKQAMAQGH
jgi:ankyrin repeat protein